MGQNTMLILEYIIRVLIIIIGTLFINVFTKYNLHKWVNIAVNAAELIYNETGMGEKKKKYVSDFINNKLKIKISHEQLDALIEAAVMQLKLISPGN